MAVGVSNFPASLDTAVELIQAENRAQSILDGSMTSGQNFINVSDASLFSNSGIVVVEDEIISYTGKTSTQLTGCARGFEGTTAASHADFLPVRQEITARSHAVLASAIIAIETRVGAGTGRVGLPAYSWFLL